MENALNSTEFHLFFFRKDENSLEILSVLRGSCRASAQRLARLQARTAAPSASAPQPAKEDVNEKHT